jgi:hypothetical protein
VFAMPAILRSRGGAVQSRRSALERDPEAIGVEGERSS